MTETILRLLSLRHDADALASAGAFGVAELAREASRQGVAGWLLHRLTSSYIGEPLSDELTSELKKSLFVTFLANQKNIKIISKMQDVLKPLGIEMVLLKGAALMRDYYPEISMRAIGDIDVWIRHDDAYKAFEALKAEGFVPENNYRTYVLQEALRTHLDALIYAGQTIEIHYNFYEPDSDMNIRGSIADHVADGRLTDVAMLYHLTTHLYKSRNSQGLRAGWVVDLVLMLGRDNVDVGQLCRDAIALNPKYEEVMCDIWSRVASLLPESQSQQVCQVTGRQEVPLTADYLDCLNLGFKRGLMVRLRSAWQLTKAVTASMAEKPSWTRFRDICSDLAR